MSPIDFDFSPDVCLPSFFSHKTFLSLKECHWESVFWKQFAIFSLTLTQWEICVATIDKAQCHQEGLPPFVRISLKKIFFFLSLLVLQISSILPLFSPPCKNFKDAQGKCFRNFHEKQNYVESEEIFLAINKFIIFVSLVTDAPCIQFHHFIECVLKVLSSFPPSYYLTQCYIKPQIQMYKLK